MLRDMSPNATGGTTAKARRLRRSMSLPEVLLWQTLRKQPEGLKFRRQHPSGAYILDFYCSDARLAVEIDGEAHGCGGRPERDAERDGWFRAAGIATLRVPATDVLRDPDAVVRAVLADAVARLPLHHPSGGPPPRDELGEDL